MTRTLAQHGHTFPASLRSISSRRRGRFDGFGNHRRRRDNGFVGEVVEERGAFDPFALAAEGHLHEFGDVVFLLCDRAAKLTDECENFLELGVEVRVVREQVDHLLAEREDFVFE